MSAKMLLLLSQFMLVVQVILASKCTNEFTQFKNCMTTAFDDLMKQFDVENKLSQIKRCFADGNCHLPDGDFHGHHNHSQGKNGACKMQVFHQLGSHIDNCVRSKVPGFTFADLFVKKAPGSSSPLNVPLSARKLGKWLRLLRNPDTCPAESREQVHRCVKQITDNAKGAMKHYVMELCSSKDKCIVKMTPNCKREFDEIKKDVVACTCDHLEPNAAKYTEEFLTCIGRNDQPNVMLKAVIEQYIPKFCQKMRENPDVCQNLRGLLGGHMSRG